MSTDPSRASAGSPAKSLVFVAGSVLFFSLPACQAGGPSSSKPISTPIPSSSGAEPSSSVHLPGRFAFASSRDGDFEIYVMNPDGTDLQQLTDDAANDHRPTWSFDGSSIAFVSDRSGTDQIWLMKEDGSDLRQLTDVSGGADGPSWSDDGNTVLFNQADPQVVYLIGIDGRDVRKVIGAADHGFDYMADAALSPDGKQVVFTGVMGTDVDLYLVSTSGGHAVALTDTATEKGSAAWSPDSTRIAFQNDADLGCLYLISAEGSDLTRVTEGCTEGFIITWSPDGSLIGWAGGPHGTDDIHAIGADGTGQLQLTTSGDISDLAWGP